MGLTVGIDLGTTYTVVSYVEPTTKKAVVIKNKYQKTITPSVVGVYPNGSYVIGEDAKVMEEEGDVNTASFYKLHMGDHCFKKHMYGTDYTAADLSAMFLKKVIEDAEKNVGQKITDAVITVPAYFENASKDDTIYAGQKAGLNVLNIINEPTAACVAYGLNEDGKDRKILIYDLGGGTFDITIAEIKKGSIEVLGTNGLHQLGGRDWDMVVATWLGEKFYEETGIDISEDEEMSAMNMISAENAKKQLSVAEFCDITVNDGIHKCKFRLTRQEFENMTDYQLTLTTEVIDQTFAEIGITWSDIDGAILVGGSTKMPMVRNYLIKHGVVILDGVNPDEAVAVGAAIQANIGQYCSLTIEGKNMSSLQLIDSSQLDLTLLPGAKVIKDVISHSLGMIMASEDEARFVNDIMIKKNTQFNMAKTTKVRELRVGKKIENNKLDIYLLQGESDDPLECSIAKRYLFYDIPYVESRSTKIEITYSHTYNGVIDIRAVQLETGKELDYRVEPIPEDMSWLEGSPKDLYSTNSSDQGIEGALVMALDLSGSMSGSPLKTAKKAMREFAENIIDYVDVGIIGFADYVAIVCNPTNDKAKVMSAIEALEVDVISNGAPMSAGKAVGYCNAANPTIEMYNLLKKYKEEDFVYGVVLTDGVWKSGACAAAKKSKEDYVKADMELVGMGFGSADLHFLKEISTRDDLASVGDVSNLGHNLSTIARIIHE